MIGDARLPQRFWAKVAPSPDVCWLWTGALSNGYGYLKVDGKAKAAHGLAYAALVGPMPDGLEPDHLCHTRDAGCPGGRCIHRRCCNPAHLEPVTATTNKRRSGSPVGINARKTHCIHGHELSGSNLYASVTRGQPQRQCRTCRALVRAAGRLRAKQALPRAA